MACVITSGINLPCRNVGGVAPEGIFIGQWQCPGANAMTIGLTSSGEISSFSGATVSFYQFCQDIEIASLSETGVVSIENGTAYNEITLTFTVFNFDQTTQNLFTSLMNGRWRVLVRSNSGNWYFLGFSNPVNVSDATGGINKMLGDLNGVTFTMTAKEALGILQVTDSAAQSVISYAS
jgi:hypothetical protein